MLKVAICDDDILICSEIESVVLEYSQTKFLEVELEVFESGERLLSFIEREYTFDLIFLDINLGGMTGVAVGQAIRNKLHDHLTKIVFISGIDGYEKQLFSVQPLNFLQKPIDKISIFECLDLATLLLELNNPFFEYKSNGKIINVTFKNILYFESNLKKVKIVMLDYEDEFYGSLKSVKECLPKAFVSPHNSFIVNLSNVKYMQEDKLILCDGSVIPISQRNAKHLRGLYF